MLTLSDLHSRKAVVDGLSEVVNEGTTPLDSIVRMSDSEQASFNGTVVVNDCKWVATTAAMPIDQANNVYSSDGIVVGVWNRKKRTFYLETLVGNLLTTKKTFKLKEETRMSDLAGMNLDALAESVKDEIAGAKPISGFGNAGTGKPLSEAQKRKQERIAEYDSVKAQLNAATDANVDAPAEVVRNNQLRGRCFGFITPADPTIKCSVKSVAKMVDGKKVLVPDAPADIVDKHNKGVRIASKYYQSEKSIVFTNSKPGKEKAMIIATPHGTDLALTSVGQNSAAVYDVSDTDLVFHILNMDVAYVYLAYNYGNLIQESDAVLGAQADKLIAHWTIKKNTKTGEKETARSIKPANRKQLTIPGNFVPLKLYNTIAVQDPSAEEKVLLNNNIAAALKRCKDLGELSAEARGAYQESADGTITSKWFDQGAPIEVSSYFGGEMITDIRVPARIKKMAKDGSPTYPFSYTRLDDVEAGPLSKKQYADIVAACGMDQDKFISEVNRACNKGSKSSTGVNREISASLVMKGVMARDAMVSSKSLADLQAEIDGLLA